MSKATAQLRHRLGVAGDDAAKAPNETSENGLHADVPARTEKPKWYCRHRMLSGRFLFSSIAVV